jgi:hypothetical protein
MRLRHIALGCALAGGLGFLAVPTGTAFADSTGPAHSTAFAHSAGLAHSTALAGSTRPAGGKPAHAGKPVSTAPATAKPQISVSSPVSDNHYGAKVTLTVTLGPTVADRTVSLYATPLGGARTLVATGAVNAERKWYARYAITTATTFTAVFAGDAYNAPNSASRTLDAYARVTDRLTGAYKTSKSGSGGRYDFFHGTGTLTLYSTVAPDKHGECLEPESEQYDKGAGWDADTKYGCDKLDGASRDAAPFSLSLAVGDRYRIRGDYLRGKDTANLSAQGPWLYFTVTK